MKDNRHPVHCRRMYRVTGDTHRGDGSQKSEENHHPVQEDAHSDKVTHTGQTGVRIARRVTISYLLGLHAK